MTNYTTYCRKLELKQIFIWIPEVKHYVTGDQPVFNLQ